MSHEDIFNTVISVVHRTFTHQTDATIYNVAHRKILQVAISLEFILEQRYIPLVESYNQQHIFRWVRNNLNIISVQFQG